MDQNLNDAAMQGNIDALYLSIANDPKVLDNMDEIPFVETPLHVAAAAGHTEFAMEMMMLKPSFARKLDPNGFTPLLLAIQKNHNLLVRELLHVHKDLVCSQGRHGMNPLHYAAKKGNLDLLVEILEVCPKSIEEVTSRSETALHVALKNDKLAAFQLLFGWLRRAWFKNSIFLESTILNWRDMDGKTVLHIAASKNRPQVVRWLLNNKGRLNVNAKNSQGTSTALDIAVDNQVMRNMLCHAGAKHVSSLPKFSWADYFRSPIPINERLFVAFFRGKMLMSNDMRNMLLVVSVLLVTIAYQAVLSPPGGFWQDNFIPGTNNQFNITAAPSATNEVNQVPHRVGTVTMAKHFFHLLAALNTLTFYIPVFIIVLVLPPDLPSFLLIISFVLLFLSYGTSIAITAPLPSYWLPYFLVLSLFLLFNIACFFFVTWKHGRVYLAFLDPEKVY